MRTKLLLPLLLFIAGPAVSQTAADKQNLSKFNDQFQANLSSYVCSPAKSGGTTAKIISSGAFDTAFVSVFGKVIFGNNELVKQGSAGSFSLNQFESKFGISFSFAHNKKKLTGGYHTVGFNAVNSSKNFNLYSADEWQRGYSLSYTFTKPFKKGIFFNTEDCKELVKKRKVARVLWLREIKAIMLTDINKIDQDLQAAENLSLYTPGTSGDNIIREIESSPIKDKISLDKIRKARADKEYLDLVVADDKKLKAYADSIVTKFDRENFSVYKYHFWWMNYSFKPEYKGIKIYDTAAASLIGIRRKDFFRVSADISANYFRNAAALVYVQLGLAVKNTNYLEGKKPADLEDILVPIPNQPSIVKEGEAVIVDDYNKFKQQFLLLNPYAGGNIFVGKKRILGFELFANYKLGFEPDDVDYSDLFTIRTGLLFSMNGKTDMGKTTFGIIAQWEDVPVKGERVNDYFTLSVRMGIPFNN